LQRHSYLIAAEQDARASKLDHPEIVVDVPLPASDDASGVVEPSKKAFDL
jgi:hypothetical protein